MNTDDTGRDDTDTDDVAQLLRTLEQYPQGMTLAEVAATLAIQESVAQRLCSGLEARQLLKQSAGRWHPGPVLARLAASARRDVVTELWPLLERLARRTGETVELCVLRGRYVVSVAQSVSDQELKVASPLGTAFALHTSAQGKAMLAELSADALQDLFAGTDFERCTDASHADLQSLLGELETIRQHGIAVDLQEHAAGVCGIGVVLNLAQDDLYTVSLAVPDLRFESGLSTLRAGLMQCKAEAEARFGVVPGGQG